MPATSVVMSRLLLAGTVSQTFPVFDDLWGGTGQLCCRCLSVGICLKLFSWSDGSYDFWREEDYGSKVPCSSHPIKVHPHNVIGHCWCWPWPLGKVMFLSFSTVKALSLPFSPPYYPLWKEFPTHSPQWRSWELHTPSLKVENFHEALLQKLFEILVNLSLLPQGFLFLLWSSIKNINICLFKKINERNPSIFKEKKKYCLSIFSMK